jgi:hypothetical protein
VGLGCCGLLVRHSCQRFAGETEGHAEEVGQSVRLCGRQLNPGSLSTNRAPNIRPPRSVGTSDIAVPRPQTLQYI